MSPASSLRGSTIASFAAWMVLLLVGCKIKEGEPCDALKPDVCAEGLRCADPSMSGAHCMTSAAANKACAGTPLCKIEGNCSYVAIGGGMCLPSSNDDCKSSSDCKAKGECTFVENHCAASTEAECKASEECAKKGLCSLGVSKGGGYCKESAPSPSP